MSTGDIRSCLLFCTLFDYALLLIWGGCLMFARPMLYRLWRTWFDLSDQQFCSLNFALIAVFKSLVIVFNLGPLLALWFMVKG